MSNDKEKIFDKTSSNSNQPNSEENVENIEKIRSERNFKSSSSNNPNQSKIRNLKFNEEFKIPENSIKNEKSNRRIKKPHSKSEIINGNSQIINKKFVAIKNVKQSLPLPLNVSNLIVFIKNIDTSNMGMEKNQINSSNKIKLYGFIHKSVFVFKKNEEKLLIKQNDMIFISKQLDQAYKLISIKEITNQIKLSFNLLDDPLKFKLLPKHNFDKCKENFSREFNLYTIKETFIKNDFFRESSNFMQKSIFCSKILNNLMTENYLNNSFLMNTTISQANDKSSLEKLNEQISLIIQKDEKDDNQSHNFMITYRNNEDLNVRDELTAKKFQIIKNSEAIKPLDFVNLSAYLNRFNSSNSFFVIKEVDHINRQDFTFFKNSMSKILDKHDFKISSKTSFEVYSKHLNLLSRLNNSSIYTLKCSNKTLPKQLLFPIQNLISNIKDEEYEVEYSNSFISRKQKAINRSISVNDLDAEVNDEINNSHINIFNININPFINQSETNEKLINFSVIDPEDQKSFGRESKIPSSNYDENSNIHNDTKKGKEEESYISPQKKNQINDLMKKGLSTDSKHLYMNPVLRKTLSDISEIVNDDIFLRFKSSTKKDKINTKKVIIKPESILVDKKEKKPDRNQSRKKGITKSLNFNNSFCEILEKEKLVNKSSSVDCKMNNYEMISPLIPKNNLPDLFNRIMNMSESDLENLMVNVPPQDSLEKQISREKNKLNKFQLFSADFTFNNKEKYNVKYECNNTISTLDFTPIQVNIKDNQNKIPPYKSRVEKCSILFNFTNNIEKLKFTIIGENPQPILFIVPTEKALKNINIDYSLIRCKLKKFSKKIKINQNDSMPTFIFPSRSATSLNLSKILQIDKNRISYNDILKFTENKTDKIERIVNKLSLLKRLTDPLKTAKSKEISRFYYLPSMIANEVVYSAINLIDSLIRSSKDFLEINQEITKNYLEISKIKVLKILSYSNENYLTSNFSLFDLSSFYFRYKHKSNCDHLFNINSNSIEIMKKIKNESWRLKTFTLLMNNNYLGKLEILFLQNFEKINHVKIKINRLKEIFSKIVEINNILNKNANFLFESFSNEKSGERIADSVIISSSIKEIFSNIAVDNAISNLKLNNFDKKNRKKKQLINNIRLKDIEAMTIQIIMEKERYSKLLVEKDILIHQGEKKKFYYLDILNYGLITIIVFLFIFIFRNGIVKNRFLESLPIESFSSE